MSKNQRSIIRDYNIIESRQEALSALRALLEAKSKGKIFLVNAHIFCEGLIREQYRLLIQEASFNLCDGINVKRLIKMTSGKKVELFPGPDLFELAVCKNYFGERRHFFLGGSEEVSKALQKKLGDLGNEYYSPPFVKNATEFDYTTIVKRIEEFEPDFVWVGLGAPKQEEVINLLNPLIKSGILVGVGAAFNFHSGIKRLRRAPRIFQILGVEWLFRLSQEPRRIARRQTRNIYLLFVGLLKYRR